MLETLLALAIFSFVALALINVSSLSVRQHHRLIEARCASWLSENLLAQALLPGEKRVMGEQQGTQLQCDITWQWRLVRQKTADARFDSLSLEILDIHGQRRFARQAFQAR
ncbi:MAG: type II secretion system minor pseudopilin GspI [Kluyvera sp.]|uniref:type II secretion system minor pseudopilin GspI n=1 Tax=Kluyvera sp. TaxID=1538228 RepID=UPI003F3405E5